MMKFRTILKEFYRYSVVTVFLFSTAISPPFVEALPAEQNNPMLHASGKKLIDANGNEIILRCVNTDPWLNRQGYLIRRNIVGLFKSRREIEARLDSLVGSDVANAFWEAWEDTFITDADFALIKAQGFNCVRIPFHYGRVLRPTSGSDSAGIHRDLMIPLEKAIESGEKHQVYVFLNLHGAPGGENDLPTVSNVLSSDKIPRLWIRPYSSQHQQNIIEVWKILAQKFRDSQYLGGYDLINEPKIPSTEDRLQLTELYKRIISAIRSIDPYHLIILEGDDYARSPGIPRLYDILDNNIMFSFHAYNLFNDRWKRPSQESFEPYLQTRDIYKIPIWLGEFGEDSQSWITSMISLAERNSIGWALWPWKRVGLGDGRPVIQEIQTPPGWNKLADYLVGTPFRTAPSYEDAIEGMKQMLNAIKTSNTIQNEELLNAIQEAQKPIQAE